MGFKKERNHSRNMTLLELFVCMSILAIVGSSVTFSSYSMINRYRFQKSAHQLAKELDWGHKMSINLAIEIDFSVKKVGSTLFCQRSADQKPPPTAHGVSPFKLNVWKFQIRNIPQLLFKGKEVSEFKITFDRTGMILPSGEITLISKNQTYVVCCDAAKNASIFAKAI